MKPTTRLKTLLILTTLALILAACGIPSTSMDDQVALHVAQTQVAMTQTALAAEGDPAQPAQDGNGPQADAPPPETTATQTQTPEPAITPTPTITLTPTLSVPMASVNRNTNCRTGPGEPYAIIGALLTNQEAEVVGVSSDGGTYIIKNPDRPGEECWLWGYYATVSGPTDGLPVRTPPPTPTPVFDWAGTWTAYLGPPEGPDAHAYTLTLTVDGKNLTGVLDGAVGLMNLTGTISDDYLSASGNWTEAAFSGTFKFYALGSNQFQGNGTDPTSFKWCGSRGGAGMPSACYKE